VSTIEYRKGDILKSSASALVNPVNCVGVAGAGLALAFKRWDMTTFDEYRKVCRKRQLLPGGVLPIVSLSRGATIYHVATKGDWREPSRFEWVACGLDALVQCALAHYELNSPIHTIAIPALGCGHGGLVWSDVKPIMQLAAEKMAAVGTMVWIYEPHD
jgi:O-acetyl-ADP-ribose deacetylase (regulator of RNase III)